MEPRTQSVYPSYCYNCHATNISANFRCCFRSALVITYCDLQFTIQAETPCKPIVSSTCRDVDAYLLSICVYIFFSIIRWLFIIAWLAWEWLVHLVTLCRMLRNSCAYHITGNYSNKRSFQHWFKEKVSTIVNRVYATFYARASNVTFKGSIGHHLSKLHSCEVFKSFEHLEVIG